MKNNANKSEFAKSIDRGLRRTRITLVTLLVILAGVIAAVAAIGTGISRSNKIGIAKTVIMQLDIQSTFKDPEFPDNGDWDNDGILNKQEETEDTGVQNADTDGDGLSDGDELTLGTDPKERDTDKDGMYDGYEMMAGTDPKAVKSDGETMDASRVVSVEKELPGCKLFIAGNPNIAGASLEELDLFGITANASVVSKAFDFYSEHPFMDAEIEIEVDQDRLDRIGTGYEDLKVLRFDVTTRTYTPVEDSSSDSKAGVVKAAITESGTYVVGSESTVNDPATTRVEFLIDNSGSMYPKELCPTSSENDVEFKRLDFAESLIDKFDKDYFVGISKFTGTYTKMCDFTTNRSELYEVLRRIRKEDEVFNGTYNQTALRNGINEFENGSDGKYRNIIVMLSDGESDETDADSAEKLVKLAKSRSVIILTVGLGRDIDREWLQNIAYETGGKYYSASDANALEDVYKQIVTTLNYDLVTYSDSNDEVTGYALYNTGFEPSRNGFTFKNFRTATTASVDFGMAVMARDWYLGNIPMALDAISPADLSELKVDAAGYDLSDTEAGSLYESRKVLGAVTTEIFGHRYSDVTEYVDYTSDGTTLEIKKKYLMDAQNKGWTVKSWPVEAGNLKWNAVELLTLDVADSADNIAAGYNSNDAELCTALYRLNALQWDDEDDEFNLTNGDEGFVMLRKQLSMGVPVVTTIDDSHTVNTIGLIRDSACHRKFILRVYDNNYPNKVKELYIEKKPVAKLAIDTEGNAEVLGQTFTYEATYEGKKVGVSFSNVAAH